MTRREYLTALNQYLVTMSEPEKTAILKEYDEHYRKGFEAGKTEAQVSASLGSPYDVANEFLAGRRPKVPTYPPKTSASTSSTSATQPRTTAQTSSSSAYQPRTTAQTPSSSAYQPRTTAQTPSSSAYQPRTTAQTSSSSAYQPRTTAQAPSSSTYQPRTTAQAPSAPAYQQAPSAPAYQQRPAAQNYSQYTQSSQAYVDYDRAAVEREAEPETPRKKKSESKYNTTGIIIVIALCVVLIPTLGGTIVGLLIGLYSLIVAFPTTGVALIAAGGALSAKSLWICLGLIFIGISFLALTGLIVMAAIEGTRLFVKLLRYVIKECKKMIKEGSF